jgi:hypothetical protein
MNIGDIVIFTVGKRLGQTWEVACNDGMGYLELVPVGSNPNMPRPTLLASEKNIRLNSEI